MLFSEFEDTKWKPNFLSPVIHRNGSNTNQGIRKKSLTSFCSTCWLMILFINFCSRRLLLASSSSSSSCMFLLSWKWRRKLIYKGNELASFFLVLIFSISLFRVSSDGSTAPTFCDGWRKIKNSGNHLFSFVFLFLRWCLARWISQTLGLFPASIW